MSADPEVIARAEQSLGQAAEFFQGNAIGQLLIGKDQQDEELAHQSMLELDPYEYDTLAKLQNAIAKIQREVRVAQRILAYIQETIEAGRSADETLGELEEQSDG